VLASGVAAAESARPSAWATFRIARCATAVALAALALAGCDRSRGTAGGAASSSATKLRDRAIAAAGGRERWAAIEDVAYASTFILYGPMGEVRSETIGIQKEPLHGSPPRVRFEPLGMVEPLVLGFDGKEAWAFRGPRPLAEEDRLVFSRFNMLSNAFWFSLPFSLAEMPVALEDLGPERADDVTLDRLKVKLDKGASEAPLDWVVLYLDARTGLIDRVLAHLTASFLPHDLWLGRWLEFQEWDGIKKERRRQFYPADDSGHPIGGLVVDQFIEDVRFNNHFPDAIFNKPLAIRGENEA